MIAPVAEPKRFLTSDHTGSNLMGAVAERQGVSAGIGAADGNRTRVSSLGS